MTILTDVDSATIIPNGCREAGHAQTNYVILHTNRARCTLNKEILDILNETRKAFLEHAVVELVYKFNDKSTAIV